MLTSVFNLRYQEKDVKGKIIRQGRRIGQIVFDPNGEYANENDQNVALTNLWKLHPEGSSSANKNEVVVYGVVKPEHDPNRSLIRLNFLEEENLQDGKDILDAILAFHDSIYIKAFRQVKFIGSLGSHGVDSKYGVRQ